ncbi:MAG: phage terminase large subunit family protein [Deltaproteobacteria bacterium]|nr:phage terminase large subunit family protein [Deltaproteobacteria bacterium]
MNLFQKTYSTHIIDVPPPMLISTWSDKYRSLSPESSAEPGTWKTNRAEYQRGIMDAANDPDIEQVVFMKSAQVGATEILNNILGYFVSQDPCPILTVQPTEKMAQAWSKDRFSPMIRDTEILHGKIRAAKSKDSDNTILHKTFPGGHITAAGANSPASLASRPVRDILLDEIDRYPASAGSEGDPVGLAIKRSETFWNKLIYLASTPTVKWLSRIEAAFKESDQRFYYVPCPKCKHKQRLIFTELTVVWEKTKDKKHKPDTAKYKCENCSNLWNDVQRWNAVRKGEWIATNQKENNNIAGFHISELYSPWVKLSKIADTFLKSKNNPERLKVFVNTSLGEVWEESGEQIEHHELYERREKYPAQIPKGGLLLTAAVDTQDDRLECDVVAWGQGQESWNIDHFVVYGDLSQNTIWNDLDSKLRASYQHENGFKFKISCCCVDTGGHFTNEAYLFCKGKAGRRIFAIKGAPALGKPLTSPPSKRNKAKINLYSIGTDTGKQTLFSRLKIKHPGPGYMHFPLERDEEYFKQLTAEKATTKHIRGFPVRVWVKTRARNEALDLRIYNMAALEILNPNFDILEKKFGEPLKEIEPDLEEKKPNPKPIKNNLRQKKKGWLNGWNQ